LFVEINRSALVLHFESRLQPDELEKNLSRLTEIRKLLPNRLVGNN